MMGIKVEIDSVYCGPPHSGNGGYSCGIFAKQIDQLVEVRLHVPPPLNTELEIQENDNGWVMQNNEQIIGSARSVDWELEVPSAPDLHEAELAMQEYQGFKHHNLPTCFVCGPKRQDDGLCIFAGPTASNPEIVASPWQVSPSLANTDGVLNREYVWAALDCPGYFAVQRQADFALLGSFSVKIDHAIHIDHTYIVVGWPIGHDGKKHYAGTAIFDTTGQCLAHAKATWITVPKEAFVASTQ